MPKCPRSPCAESAHAWGRSRACKIEHPINELVRSNTSALLDAEGEGEPTEYVLVLVDIIYAGAVGHHLRRCWRTSSTPTSTVRTRGMY